MPYEKNNSIPYVHKPNLVDARGRGCVIFNTDNIGLRAAVSGACYGPKMANEYRIAIAGNSFTFGEGVRKTEDTYCQVLERILNNQRNAFVAKVFNFGVSAYNVKNMADTLKLRMLDIKPDLAIMAIIQDDFILSRTAKVDKWGYTVNEKLSGFMPSNSIVKLLLRKIYLSYFLRDLRYFLLHMKQAEKNACRYELPDTYMYVKKFATISREQGIHYLVVLLPTCPIDNNQQLIKQLDRDHISYLDLSFIAYEFPKEIFRSTRFDGHPSVIVHKRIAEALADYINQNRLRMR